LIHEYTDTTENYYIQMVKRAGENEILQKSTKENRETSEAWRDCKQINQEASRIKYWERS
jgi:phosphoribosyl-ATP pyrophosphohydrolase